MHEDARAAWHAERKTGLGGSDIAPIMGISPWRSGLDVWAEKTGRAEPDDATTLAMWLGLRLEPVLFELYEARMGSKVRRVNKTRHHPTKPWMLANLDGKVEGAPILVEAKVSSGLDLWGPEASADIPPYYVPQVQHYMAVTGFEMTHVVALLGGRVLRVYEVPADLPYIADLYEFEEWWWNRHVIEDRQPDADGSDASLAFLKRHHPANSGRLRAATPEESMLVRGYRGIKATHAEAARALEEAENRLRQAIGDDDGIAGSGFTVTWKRTKDGSKTNWEAVAAAYRAVIHSCRAAGYTAEQTEEAYLDALVSLQTTATEGYRRFYAHFSEEQ